MIATPERRWNLTSMQWATLARSLIAPESGCYIQQLVCDWSSPADLDRWREVWAIIGSRHQALRACFEWQANQELGQRFANSVEVAAQLEIVGIDGSSEPAEARAGVLDNFLALDRRRGFQLHRPPLWRMTVFHWGSAASTTVWTFHHALLDGRSHLRVWREACTLYRTLAAGMTVGPPPPPEHPFTEFLDWLTAESSNPAPGRTYWVERLAGFQKAVELPSLAVALDFGIDTDPATAESRTLGAKTTTLLQNTATRFGVTLNNLVQGVWALALGRYEGVEDVVFGTTRSCRHWTKVSPEGRIGLFINTVPFRVDVSPSKQVGPWLRELRSQQLALRTAEFTSAQQIRTWCGMETSLALMRTALVFEKIHPEDPDSDGPTNSRLIEKTDVLTLAVNAGQDLTLTIDFAPSLHPRRQIIQVLNHLELLLHSLITAVNSQTLGSLPMLTATDRHSVLEEWQGRTETDFQPVHRVIEAQVARTPRAPAVEFQETILSYEMVNERANRLARRLLDLTDPGDRVCVILDRCLDQVVAWLALLKSGRIYAPIDPSNAAERLHFYLQDLQPAVILTHHGLRPLIPDHGAVLLTLDDPKEQGRQACLDGANLHLEMPPETPVNLLYTSGSTGVPKAVLNGLGGLSNFAAELRRTFDISPDDRVLLSSATSFDASLFDLVASLQSGATLVLVPLEYFGLGGELHRILTENRITVTLLTPSAMRSTPVPSSHLRLVVSAGEPLAADLAAQWFAGRRLFNVCGPTECSVWTHCEEVVGSNYRPTIGRLIPNCRGYILDESLQPVAIGVPGELYLSGVGVGLGYWNRPELTRERFLPDPFMPGSPHRMFRTGDRVRWLPDGRVEYLGRFDFQVKIHGIRVELGEIEAALRSHPGIADAVVALHKRHPVAWLIASAEAPSVTAMRAWLSQRIPLIFEPSQYNFVTTFPYTRTGKVDRARLLVDWLAHSNASESTPADVSTDERQLVLHTRNQTARPYHLDRSVVCWFEEQAITRPDAVALEDSTNRLSYDELNRRANRVAHRLLRAQLSPSEVVAVRLERSMEFVIAAMGIMKAGGAYLPLEIHVPSQRQQWILEDCGARFALTTVEHHGTFASWKGQAEIIDHWTSASVGARDTNPNLLPDSRQLAYLIYTSGSTGTPKGVEIEHRSLSNLIHFYHERLELSSQDRLAMVANPVFDASVADLWPGLCAGGTILIPRPADLMDPERFIDWLADRHATFSFAPTSFGEILLSLPWPDRIALRHLTLGGDILRCFAPPGLPFKVWNTYGPTENTVDSVWAIVPPLGRAGCPPIGRPIANVMAYVLNGNLEPTPTGTAGELFLGGEQVARGYRNRPDLTQQAFLQDPFSSKAGARMYRTGDRVRWNTEGELEFLGRLDDQIQIRGQRVELGEIEGVIRQHPFVREVCCRPVLDGDSVSGVTAHLIIKLDAIPADSNAAVDAIRAFAVERLPSYMVPSRFVCHARFPLTPQGKVDRAALSAAQPALADDPSARIPEDSLELTLTQLWYRLLPQSIGTRRDRPFQELGGDSLLAVKLLLGVHEITGRRLALSTFLLSPSLEGLCRAASLAEMETRVSVLALKSNPFSQLPPVFCMYQLTGDVSVYMDLAEILGRKHSVYGVRSPALNNLLRAPESIEAAATQVRNWIRQVRPEGPFILLGYSWGGLLAFEVARQCAEDEGVTPFCALFGTHAPLRNRSLGERLFHALRAIPPWAMHFVRDRGQRARRLLSAGAFLRRLRRNLASNRPEEMPEWTTSPLIRHHIELALKYHPPRTCPVPIHLIRERDLSVRKMHPAEHWWTDHEADGGWHRWTTCAPEVDWLEGDHTTILKPPLVGKLGALLEAKFSTLHPPIHPSTKPRPASREPLDR